MKFSNPGIPEGINTSPDHPLKEFAWLLGSVSLLIITVIIVLGFMAEFLATRIPFSYEMELAGRFAGDHPDPSPTRDYLQDSGIAERLRNRKGIGTIPAHRTPIAADQLA